MAEFGIRVRLRTVSRKGCGFESHLWHHVMNLKYSLGLRLAPKTYLLAQLLILIGLSLSFTSASSIWLNLLVAWLVAILLELILNAAGKKIVHLPDAALISATIIVGVLASSTPTPIIALVVAISILAKHFVHYRGKHIFNPANLGILLAVFILGQNAEWWVASNVFAIVGLGLFVMYKIRRLLTPIIFLTLYFLLLFVTTSDIHLEFIKNSLVADFSIYFFAFIMLPEPRTAAWTSKGRYINSGLTAIIGVVLSMLNVKVPLLVALATVNLLTPLVNNYTKTKKYEN